MLSIIPQRQSVSGESRHSLPGLDLHPAPGIDVKLPEIGEKTAVLTHSAVDVDPSLRVHILSSVEVALCGQGSLSAARMDVHVDLEPR